MFKKIQIFVATLFCLIGAVFASNTSFALTDAELQAQINSLLRQVQINSLLQQVEALQRQLAELQGQTPTQTPRWCYNFDKNLKFGDKGTDVKNLNKALAQEGLIGAVEGEKDIFDEQTASAVTGFQEKYANEILAPLGLKYGTGIVGSATRVKLNKIYGCGSRDILPPKPTVQPIIISPRLINPTAQGTSVTYRITYFPGVTKLVVTDQCNPNVTIFGSECSSREITVPITSQDSYVYDWSLTYNNKSTSTQTVGISVSAYNSSNQLVGKGSGSVSLIGSIDIPPTVPPPSNKSITVSSKIISQTLQGTTVTYRITYVPGVTRLAISNSCHNDVKINGSDCSSAEINVPITSADSYVYDWTLNYLNKSYEPRIVGIIVSGYNASGQLIGTDSASISILSHVPGSKVRASLISASEDRVGAWNIFGPGSGNVNKNPSDWKWKATLTAGKSLDISRITIVHNVRGEVWSTGSNRYLSDGTDLYGYKETPYPLVVFNQGRQLNNQYDHEIMTVSQGTFDFELYGQPESVPFRGGKIIFEFADGTILSGEIPPSDIVPQTNVSSITVSPRLINPTAQGTSVTYRITYFPGVTKLIVTNQCNPNVTIFGSECSSREITVPITSQDSYVYDWSLTYNNKSTSTQTVGISVSAYNSSNQLVGKGSGSVSLIGSIDTSLITVPSITVLSPNGEEVLEIGKTYPIRWKTINLPSYIPIEISLVKRSAGKDEIVYTIVPADTKKVTAASLVYYWTIPSSVTISDAIVEIKPGEYYISVGTGPRVVSGDLYGIEGRSFPFKINSLTTQPYITVLSPNGGEVWNIGSTQQITWNTRNIASPNDKITIYLVPADDLSKNINLVQEIPNTGSYSYIVDDPSKFSYLSPLYKAGNKFKIYVCAKAANSNNLCSYAVDYSDAPFSIANNLTVDLKVNGSDSPSSVVEGSTFVASWTSTGAKYCYGFGQDVLGADGTGWTSSNLAPSGSKTLYAKSLSNNNQSLAPVLFSIGIQCFDADRRFVTDSIIVPVRPIIISQPVSTSSVPQTPATPTVQPITISPRLINPTAQGTSVTYRITYFPGVTKLIVTNQCNPNVTIFGSECSSREITVPITSQDSYVYDWSLTYNNKSTSTQTVGISVSAYNSSNQLVGKGSGSVSLIGSIDGVNATAQEDSLKQMANVLESIRSIIENLTRQANR